VRRLDTILRDLGAYKDNLITMFLKSEKICELLLGENYTDCEIDNLVYSQIFPFPYIENTQTETKPYMCIETDFSSSSHTIKDVMIYIWVYAHKDVIGNKKRVEKYKGSGYAGTFIDILADIIDQDLRKPEHKNKYGVGSPTLKKATPTYPNNNYYGRQMTYVVSDFKVKAINEKKG